MSTYDLDNADVSYLMDILAERDSQQSVELGQRLAAQRPIPAPRKIGAVVKTYAETIGNRTFLRYAYDGTTHEPWIEPGNTDHTYRTDGIGRITEVLAPGVDL